VTRAANSAVEYVQKQMSPADLIAIVSLANTVTVNQDFTSDRDQLLSAIQAFNPESGRGLEEGAAGETAEAEGTVEAFTGDETEFNIFNTDRRLEAIRSLADALATIEQRKSVLYFASGLNRTGIENQSQLRVAINAAVRANLSIYTVDVRGLQAFPPGCDAPADFQHSTKEDRDRQIQEQLASDLPNTDLPVYLSTGYFRLSDVRYFVPVSVVVPGAAIPFTRAGDEDRSTLDVAGVVRDKSQRPFGIIRDTVKLAVESAKDVKRKNVQYDTGFLLPPGDYSLKVVLRENQTGQTGSFETEVIVPNLKDAPLK